MAAAPPVRGRGRAFDGRRRRIPLGVKVTFIILVTIGVLMALTTWLTYRQQQRSLRNEVVQRGASIARSLASSAAEVMLRDLECAAMIYATMPKQDFAAAGPLTLETVLDSLRDDILGRSGAEENVAPNAGVVEIVMVKADGTIAAHNDINMVSKPYLPPPGVRPYQGEAMLIQEYLTPQGEGRFDIAVPVRIQMPDPVTGRSDFKRIGEVHLRMTQRLVDMIVEQAAYKLLLVTGVLMVLGLIMALILSRYLTRPINKLMHGVKAIASGDLNQELRVTRTDELGELTAAFNEMAASLREKELIKGAFSTYVSSQVMEQVLADPNKLALGGARKRVTCMFTDIRGFTAMSETMEPEDVVSVINVYLSLQTEIVLKNEGMLDKFVGDCVMGVFGLPFAKPDDALRAVRTAVQIQQAVRALNESRTRQGRRTVTIGIGINTGEVVAGNMGSAQKMDYTVIGDAVNLAARLEANAEGGTILISEASYREVAPYVVAEKLMPIPVKGKRDKVQVYSLRGMRPPAGAAAS